MASDPSNDATISISEDEFALKLAAIPRQKMLGAFYTPDEVAAPIVRWALDGQLGRVLEPSFGGCSFLRASVAELRRLGGDAERVVGVDVDPAAAAPAAADLVADGLPLKNLVYEDFLGLRTTDLGTFSAVVGNPPFVRHQWQHPQWQRDAQKLMRESDVPLSQRASAWAYFAVHAVTFLEISGRLALVLPGAALHADYAKTVVEFFERRFASVRLLRLRDRLFEGTEEEAVILLAAGRGTGRSRAVVQDVEGGAPLTTALASPAGAGLADIKTARLTKPTRQLLHRILNDERVAKLGDIATVRIGVVTGANDFFVRSKDQLPGLVGTRGVAVVSRSAWLQHPWWEKADLNRYERAGSATRLLTIDPQWRRRGVLAEDMTEAEEAGIADRRHCQRRTNWWSLDDVRSPDAFLPYMGARPRGLVFNKTRATCTNAVHRIDFTAVVDRVAVCASTWTSLFDVVAELRGRHYGGGVLKIEPSVAKTLPVLTTLHDPDQLVEVRSLFERGEAAAARRRLDELYLSGGLGLTRGEVAAFRSAAEQLQKWRVHAR